LSDSFLGLRYSACRLIVFLWHDSFSYTSGSIVGQQDLPLSIKLSMKLLFAVRMRWDGNHRLDLSLRSFILVVPSL
jgi:hypothetical protein